MLDFPDFHVFSLTKEPLRLLVSPVELSIASAWVPEGGATLPSVDHPAVVHICCFVNLDFWIVAMLLGILVFHTQTRGGDSAGGSTVLFSSCVTENGGSRLCSDA